MGPGSGTNAPPVIQSLAAGAPQVEVTGDQTVQLTAAVTDAESSAAQLTYIWSASPANGTFAGAGAQVRWKAPAAASDPSTITLTVVENYGSGSAAKENRVSSSRAVRYNDLIIGGLVNQFLTDFGTFSVTPEQCVRNFSNSCPKKFEELNDVRNNRALVHIESAVFSISSISMQPSGTFADIVAPCVFKDTRNSDGKHQTQTGNCLLGATYENSRWLLCYSDYQPISSEIQSAGGRMIIVDGREAPFSHP